MRYKRKVVIVAIRILIIILIALVQHYYFANNSFGSTGTTSNINTNINTNNNNNTSIIIDNINNINNNNNKMIITRASNNKYAILSSSSNCNNNNGELLSASIASASASFDNDSNINSSGDNISNTMISVRGRGDSNNSHNNNNNNDSNRNGNLGATSGHFGNQAPHPNTNKSSRASFTSFSPQSATKSMSTRTRTPSTSSSLSSSSSSSSSYGTSTDETGPSHTIEGNLSHNSSSSSSLTEDEEHKSIDIREGDDDNVIRKSGDREEQSKEEEHNEDEDKKSPFQFIRNTFSSIKSSVQIPVRIRLRPQKSSNGDKVNSPNSRELSSTRSTSTSTAKSKTSSASMISLFHLHHFSSILRKLALFLLAIVLFFVISMFVSGTYHLMNYRNNFKDAPIPNSPAHGVIVSHPFMGGNNENGNVNMNGHVNGNGNSTDNPITTTTKTAAAMITSHVKHANYTFKAFNPIKKSSPLLSTKSMQENNEHQKQKPPLRLLIIGDSIARGVGQSENCYPLLPQSIGKYLSQKLNGRAVYWTTMAEPGAMTKSLKILVGESLKQKKKKSKQLHSDNNDHNHDHQEGETFLSLKQFKERHLSYAKPMNSLSKEDWIENLAYHRQLYAQNQFGDYDIVIIIAGVNDAKRVLLPFMFSRDETTDADESESETGTKERGFAKDMKQLIDLLHIGHSLDDSDERQRQERQNSELSGHSCMSHTEMNEETCLLPKQKSQNLPMIVLPRVAAELSPAKLGTVFRMFGTYLIHNMDGTKGKIASQYDDVISPNSSFQESAYKYLSKLAKKYANFVGDESNSPQLVDDDTVLVNLIDLGCDDCKRQEDMMQEFYSRQSSHHDLDEDFTELFAKDAVHPNDSGYNFLGEFLAKEIFTKWGHDRLSQ